MVQLSKYFVWFVSLFAVATSLIACSDDADEGTLLPEMVGDWDIVVANIVSDVIIALAPTVGELLAKGKKTRHPKKTSSKFIVERRKK